jgi:hypothetical protein
MRAARVDDNHRAVKRALEQIGCSVLDLAAVGGGAPDLVVGWRGRNFLVEVKDGSKPPSKRRLTPQQQTFHAQWRGQIMVVTGVADAIDRLQEQLHAPV